MRFPAFITLVVAILIGIGVLFFIGNYGVSIQAVPSLSSYIASSTKPFGRNATSTDGTASSTVGSVPTPTEDDYFSFNAPEGVIRVTAARSPATRERGLSGRAKLADDEGLLFIFPQAGEYGFWMKGMNFPIDIIWMSSNYRVIGVAENALPESYPATFPAPGRAQFVLEVNAGNAAKYGLKAGAAVSF